MKEKDRIWHLMARKLSGEAMEEEIKELELFLSVAICSIAEP